VKNSIILDGYNVIYKIPYLADKLKDSLAEARKSLALYMADWNRKNTSWDVCIVFDGRDQGAHLPSEISLSGIDCHFTKPGTEADDYIIAIVRQYHKSQKILVVSGDGKVHNNCKAYGIETVHPRFLEGRTGKRKISSNCTEAKSTSQHKESEITKWYKEQMNKRP
jgi:predicted RNA-binding protein with PIN domain